MFRIGLLAQQTGVLVETIRYYEHIGLMPKPARTESGHRMYSIDHVMRLKFIRKSRRLDFSLDEIRVLLQAAEAENPSCGEVEKFSEKHLSRLREKIKEFKAMEKTLKVLLTQCRANEGPSCPLIDVLYEKVNS